MMLDLYWPVETLRLTGECLHFEHRSSFDYSVINVVYKSDGNGNKFW